MPHTDYYVYLYRDPRDSTPFYIGHGRGPRARFHWQMVRSKSSERELADNLFNTRLRELRDLNLKPLIEVVAHGLLAEEAVTQERELIRRFGRADLGEGPLLNGTDGGERGAHAVANETDYLARFRPRGRCGQSSAPEADRRRSRQWYERWKAGQIHQRPKHADSREASQ